MVKLVHDYSMNRKHVFAWVLYDFANSVYPGVVTATIFSVYFTSTIVGNEGGLGDLWWGRMLSTSLLFVALSSPFLGSVSDRAGARKRMLFFYTYLCVFSVALFVTIEPGMIFWGLALAFLANVGFEGALVFYNAYLPELAPPNRQGFISGLGFSVGYAGSVVGLLIALPLVNGEDLDLIWLSVAIFFAIFSLPSFLFLPPDRVSSETLKKSVVEITKRFTSILNEVLKQRELRRFLLAFFFYIDGIITTIYFAAIFADTTLGFEKQELIYLFLLVQIAAFVGALSLSKATDIWGPKKIINGALIMWTAVLIAVYFVESKTDFFVLSILAGSGLGAVQAASRSLMSSLIPPGKEAEMFGCYAFCGKSSSILGPLVFGQVSFYMGGNQRVAILSVVAFLLIGLTLLQRVKVVR